MIKETELRALLLEFAEQFSQGETYDELIDELMCKVYPPKNPKEPEVVVDFLVGDIQLSEEELEDFNDEPIEFIREFDMPDFSTMWAGAEPEAYDGDELFCKVNGKLFSFQIKRGACVEATWEHRIFETDIYNVVEIPESEIGNYNLKNWSNY
jgi:hypothetical protein